MVKTLNPAGPPIAIEPAPETSLRSLDAVNFLLAGALSGFGPYVALYLAEQQWAQQNIGIVLTAAGLAGLLSQLPAGGLLDAIRSKRSVVALGATMVALSAIMLALWPSFPVVSAALVLQGITGGFPGSCDCGHQSRSCGPFCAGRTARTKSTVRIGGRRVRRYPHGLDWIFPVVSCNLPRRGRTCASDAIRALPHPTFKHPLRPRLWRPRSSRHGCTPKGAVQQRLDKPQSAHICRLRFLVPDGQCIDAAARRRGARA